MTVCYTVNNTEIIDSTEHAFDRLQAMKRAEKKAIKRKAERKRKERMDEIKLTLGLSCMMILSFSMFLHWLYIGY